MPYALIKHKDGSYSVKNKETGNLHAIHTTKQKAVAQMRLLYLIDSGGKLRNK
jgi:hypothetical protein